MTDQEIQGAVKELAHIRTGNKSVDLLCSLATQYLQVKGLPEKLTSVDCESEAFNEALSLGRLYLINRLVGLEEVIQEEKLQYYVESECPTPKEIADIVRKHLLGGERWMIWNKHKI